MPTRIASRRRNHRHAVVLEAGAYIEFEFGIPAEKYRLKLSDLSHSGLSFNVDSSELPPVEPGTTVPAVSIRIRECIIQGDIVVMHVTTRPESRVLVGALLYPATDHDLLKLKAVLAGMEAVTSP